MGMLRTVRSIPIGERTNRHFDLSQFGSIIQSICICNQIPTATSRQPRHRNSQRRSRSTLQKYTTGKFQFHKIALLGFGSIISGQR